MRLSEGDFAGVFALAEADVRQADLSAVTDVEYFEIDRLAVAGLADGELSPQATCQSTSSFVPPVGNLQCSALGQAVELTWTNGGTYEAVRIESESVGVAGN